MRRLVKWENFVYRVDKLYNEKKLTLEKWREESLPLEKELAKQDLSPPEREWMEIREMIIPEIDQLKTQAKNARNDSKYESFTSQDMQRLVKLENFVYRVDNKKKELSLEKLHEELEKLEKELVKTAPLKRSWHSLGLLKSDSTHHSKIIHLVRQQAKNVQARIEPSEKKKAANRGAK